MTKIIILAAGEGKRLRPHTLEKPKCMVHVDGKSLISHQLGILKAEAQNNIVIVNGYKAECFDIKDNIKYYKNHQFASTNMVCSLFSARKEFSGTIVVSYGDIVYSRQILRKLIDSPDDISVVVDRQWRPYWESRFENPLDDAETLKIGNNGCIIDIGQRANSMDEIEGQYIGLMKFQGKGLDKLCDIYDKAIHDEKILGKSIKKAYMTDLLQGLILSGENVCPLFIEKDWIEVDTSADLNAPVTLARLRTILK